jgi:hypothetical protein
MSNVPSKTPTTIPAIAPVPRACDLRVSGEFNSEPVPVLAVLDEECVAVPWGGVGELALVTVFEPVVATDALEAETTEADVPKLLAASTSKCQT